MPITSRYAFLVSMDVAPDREALFNEIYDTEHVPNLLQVPGVLAISRMKAEDFVLSIGGETQRINHESALYHAIYEIESPEVLVSAEWAKAVEAGRWPERVRPFTTNRTHALYRLR